VIFIDGNGRVAFGAKDNSPSAQTRYLYSGSFSNPVTINDGEWHHVAVTWGRGPNEVIMYIDGTEVSRNTNGSQPGQQPFPGGLISHSSAITLGYGVSPSGGGPVYFDGEIDEFRVWNGVRPGVDIQTFMSTHLNPLSFAGLSVNFDFNETNGTNGWEDCASGIISPTSVSNPTVNLSGGPSMTFNFAYTWTNTSGNTQNGANYQKSFLKADTVVVEAGYCKYLCTDTFYVEIADCDTVKDPRDVAAVFAPTAFTPNGDTKNDYYIVKANAISYFEMQVYNRDGNILFHSKDINTGWDGSFENRQCTEGVYIAQIMYRDNEGMEYVKYQQFSLMR
jgi:gliding motility-associated-like protein